MEDLVEFLIREKLAKTHCRWKSAIEAGRSGFQDKQLRAAVRRHQQTAVDELERLGYSIKRPRK